MTPLESTVSDAQSGVVKAQSLEASFTLIRDVYSAGLNYDDCQLTLTWL